MYTMNEVTEFDNRLTADPASAADQAQPPGVSHPSLRDVVTDAIRQAILSGRYLPGQRLVEDRLAAEFAVSRNPIRESLRALEVEGLVNIAPRRGATVAQLSETEMLEIVELRAALEGLSARMAARRCTAEVRTSIEDMLKRGAAAIAGNDLADLAQLNNGFHDLLSRASRNRLLAEFMRPLRDRTHWLQDSTVTWRARQSWDEHAGILKAIVDGDEELAALLSRRHVTRAGLSRIGGATSEGDSDGGR